MTKRIAITGPESTGKTWLAENLARHYQTVCVPEFARSHLLRLNRPYTFDDILFIAKSQFQNNQQALSGTNTFLFCDTELIVTKIWCEVKYGYCHQWILDHIGKQHFDLYLVPDIDLPWEPDPQREHPHMRDYLMQLYLKELEARKFPYRLIGGEKEERLRNAVEALELLA
jgi:nicotinamide riboside kinase